MALYEKAYTAEEARKVTEGIAREFKTHMKVIRELPSAYNAKDEATEREILFNIESHLFFMEQHMKKLIKSRGATPDAMECLG